MTRVRRPLAVAAGLALAAILTLPTGAAGQEPEPDCKGEVTEVCLTWESAPGAEFTGAQRLAGSFDTVADVERLTVRLDRVVSDEQFAEECKTDHIDHDFVEPTAPTTPPPTPPPATSPTTGPPPQRFSIPVEPPCNGRYHVTLTAHTQPACPECVFHLGDLGDPADAIRVSLPPPDVAATSVAIARNRTVTVSWQAPSGYSATSAGAPPPDFLGYVVDRSTDGGTTFARRASLGPTVSSFTETLGPSDPAGSYTYRVLAVRYGATTSEFAVAAGGATAIARLDVAAPPTSAPPTTRTPTSAGAPSRPSNNAAPTVERTIPPTTTDEGFGELLYDDEEPGEEAAVLPDDADSLLDFASPGAGILVPFAIAECLAVWALHLRYLARRVDAGV